MRHPPSLIGCLATGLLLALGVDALLWAWAALVLRSEFAGVGAALVLVFLLPSGLFGGLLLYGRGRFAARRRERASPHDPHGTTGG